MPSNVVQFLTFAGGLALLVAGAELFIRGAVRVARRLGISPFVIGLTLVGFGTSAPEIVVNLTAAVNDAPGLALGNVVGANVANVGLILGLAAIIRPLTAHMRLLRVEVPVVIAASVALWLMARDGTIGRADGLILLAGFAGMTAYIVRSARRESAEVKEELGHLAENSDRLWVSACMVVCGVAGLGLGADLMVEAAVDLARHWGVPDAVIGLTIVAVGTTLPELASTLAAAYRGEADIAVGNVVGSNLFNLLLIVGLTSQVRPLAVPESLRTTDIPVMIGFAVMMFAVLASDLRVSRWKGAILLASYVGFIVWQVDRAGG